MREVLFRGFHPCDGPGTIVVDGEKVKGRWVEGYLWSKRTIGVTSPCGNLDEVVVLPSTVGQYSGQVDFLGDKIFSHDLLQSGNGAERIFVVDFDDGGYFFRERGKAGAGTPLTIEEIGWYMLEKIGTVFDEEAVD